MASIRLQLVSPLPVYFDEITTGGQLARRPASLDGKVLGLLPNLRPAAVPLLRALGVLLEKRYHLKSVVMEKPAERDTTRQSGKLHDTTREHLNDFARRVDVAIAASAD